MAKKTKTQNESTLLDEWEAAWPCTPAATSICDPIDELDAEITEIDERIDMVHDAVREKLSFYRTHFQAAYLGKTCAQAAPADISRDVLKIIDLLVNFEDKIADWQRSSNDAVQAARARGVPSIEHRWDVVIYIFLSANCEGPLQKNLRPPNPSNDRERDEDDLVWVNEVEREAIIRALQEARNHKEKYLIMVLTDYLARLCKHPEQSRWELMGEEVKVPTKSKPAPTKLKFEGLSSAEEHALTQCLQKIRSKRNGKV